MSHVDSPLPLFIVNLCERFLMENRGDELKAADAMVEHLANTMGVYKRERIFQDAVRHFIGIIAKNRGEP